MSYFKNLLSPGTLIKDPEVIMEYKGQVFGVSNAAGTNLYDRLLEALGASTSIEKQRFLEENSDALVLLSDSTGRKSTKTLEQLCAISPLEEVASPGRTVAVYPLPGRTEQLVQRRNLLFVCLLILSGILTSVYIYGKRTPLTPSQQLARLQSTAFEGILRPIQEVSLLSFNSGIVQEVTVKPGDKVEKGQVLIRLQDPEAQASLEEAKFEEQEIEKELLNLHSRLAEANASFTLAQQKAEHVPTRQWRDSIERAQASYDLASSRYRRAEELHKAGIIAQQDFEVAENELRLAKNDLQNARTLDSGSKAVEQAQEAQGRLQAELAAKEQQQVLERAKLKVQQAQQRADAATIRASDKGLVIDLFVRPGDQVAPGNKLLRLAKLEQLRTMVPVSETIMKALHIGQKARVRIPTMPPQEVEAHITRINPLRAANMDHEIDLEFDNKSGELLAGQPAEVYFLKD